MASHGSKRRVGPAEVGVASALVALFALAMVPSLSERMARTRDARRVADARAIAVAIEAFHRDHGRYPTAQKNAVFGGWDVSHDGSFIRELADAGYLADDPRDPLNDNEHHYRYYVYPAGSYGCASSGPFWVLGIRRFESTDLAGEQAGGLACPGRDWSTTFAYVLSGGTAND
jgi:type II secretory pathway pseudopilin PulG